MKLKNWIKNLFKPKFYLWLQPNFLSGSCGQNIPVHLKSFEPYMPFSSARRAAIRFCWVFFLAIPVSVFGQTNYYGADGTQYAVIGSLPGDQTYPAVALNTNGGYIVWQDNITDPVGEGISAMQLSSTLSGSGDAFQVNTTSTNDQGNARVSLLNKGGGAFVWQGGPAAHQYIYGRILNAKNVWLNKTNFLVSSYTNTFQGDPAIATLTNGNLIVVWDSYDQSGPTNLLDVYGQMLSTNGTKIGTNFLINQFTAYNQHNPAVAALPNGGFVVAWVSEQERSSAPDWGVNGFSGLTGTNELSTTNGFTYTSGSFPLPSVDIYQRLYTISGTSAVPSTDETLVNQDANPCGSPDVAVASDGSYMITWCAKNMANPANSWDIYERSFAGGNGGQVNLVNSVTYGDQYDPHISVIGGDYLIVWTSLGQDGDREGVFGQFVHEGDSLVGGEFLVNTITRGQQMEPAVASDGEGQFLAVWTSFTFGPDGFDLYAQRYENTAAVLEPMAAPFVWAPFNLVSGVYQPQLVVVWPPVVNGVSISDYSVYADAAATNIAAVVSNEWIMTAANGLKTNSTHSFALEYTTAAGFTSPMSPSASGTTWSGQYWGTAADPIPDEWMTWFYGTNKANWPSASAPLVANGPTPWQIFETGGNPTNSATWLKTTYQGRFLVWNTQPGKTYQVQVTTDFQTWTNVGSPRFASGTSDEIYMGNGAAGYYRVQLLWQ
jgi:hypothetical protein